MKISIKELSKYVKIDNISPVDIADKLTFAGIEVESVDKIASGTNLVIGQILECEKHPDSDHLHVLKVDLGSKYGIVQIVCGAPNARKDLKVIVARVGAQLPLLEIKAGNIRGVDSNGMCCSLLELGVDKKFLDKSEIEGIHECDVNAQVGDEDVFELLGLDDTILDLKPLANRPDANSILCVAKEVAALFQRQFINICYDAELKKNILPLHIQSCCSACKKFEAVVVEGIDVHESPKWLKNILTSSGIRSINNIVDIGNYVMLLTGQPLHMYDYDKLEVKELVVKDDITQEFLALDENKYNVITGDITINSGNNIECLGGVMGSLHSETTLETKRIVIEAAIFEQKSVRITSNRLGLSSDSSALFTKGINKNGQEFALSLAISFLKKLAEAESASVIYSYDEIKFSNLEIPFTHEYINKRLGTNFSFETINDTFERLNISVSKLDEKNYVAIIPDYRIDIADKADLSEEIIRLQGFDKIKSVLPETNMSVGIKDDKYIKNGLISDYLVNNGYYQILTYSLVNEKQTKEINLFEKSPVIALLNPLTDDHKYLRTSLIPSMLTAISYNIKRKNKDLKFFEISNIYTENTSSSHLCVCVSGNELLQGQLHKEPFCFFTLKGVFESIIHMFGIEQSRYKLEKCDCVNSYFHPGKSAIIKVGNKIAGVIGDLHPNVYKEYDLGKSSTIVLEISLDLFYEMKTSEIKAKEWSKYPSVQRDLAFFISKDITAGELIKEVKKAGSPLVQSVDIFDVYENINTNDKTKSVAISLIFNSQERTLKEEEIVSTVAKVIEDLKAKFNIEQRS
ncbi:MAG: phenylalanine--tRNA ligase subunit beta [Bacilli bacterium]